MPSPSVTNTFRKLIHICNKNQIVNIINSNGVTSLKYGPLGSLLKRNIFNEWLYFFLNNTDVNVFPLEISNPRKLTGLLQSNSDETSRDLLQDVIGNYFETRSRFGYNLPFGLALYGPCVSKDVPRKESSSDTDSNILSNLEAWTHISVIFFYPPKKSMNWFHHWSKQRNLWWRKYSSVPSEFSMSDITRIASGADQLSLLLQYPWGKNKLETITLHNNKFVEELCQNYHNEQASRNSSQDSVPAIITCETELDLAVMAHLNNSFAQVLRDGKNKNVLHLHSKLTPYKVCLTIEETDKEHLKKLKTTVSLLTKELKDIGISVLPGFDSNSTTTIQTEFERYDEMGIPYVIVLSENSLQTGIAALRNRDTTLQEQVHISELALRLVKDLKIKR